MYKQPQMCRKKSAFRQKLRKEYIDNLFRSRRVQYQQEQTKKYGGLSGKEEREERMGVEGNGNRGGYGMGIGMGSGGNMGRFGGVRYPYRSDCIPVVDVNRGICFMDTEEIGKKERIREFVSYQHFCEYINDIMKGLPKSIYTLVTLLNNNPQLTPQFLTYLLTPTSSLSSLSPCQPLLTLTQTLPETSPSQFSNYIHILQSLLLHLPQSSETRLSLVCCLTEKITKRTFALLQHNKMLKMDILKYYFDYLVTLGNDVRVLGKLEVVMVLDFVREVFVGGWDEDGGRWDQLYDSVILLCNMVISLDNHNLPESPNTPTHLNTLHQTQSLKSLFLTHLLTTPKLLQNISLLGLSASTNLQLQHILRFFINLTFLINKPEMMYVFIDCLVVLVRTVLGQGVVYGAVEAIGVLVLRLVNNVMVGDGFVGEVLWREGVIARIVDLYGTWCLNGLDLPQPLSTQPQPQPKIFLQFLSTITTYIILLNNEPTQSLTHTFIHNLHTLIKSKYIHLIILQALTHSWVVGGVNGEELVLKCLEALLVLGNYQGQGGDRGREGKEGREGREGREGDWRDGVCWRLVGYRDLLENIRDRTEVQNIGALCEQLLEIVKSELQKDQQRKIEQQTSKKYQQIYEEYFKQTPPQPQPQLHPDNPRTYPKTP